MPPYVVRPGDHLAQIALRHRVAADRAWRDPRNDALRARGRSPEQLAPGDVLFLPDPDDAPQPLDVGGFSAYRAQVPRARVPVALRDATGPLRDTEFAVEGLGAPHPYRTDGDGHAVIEVPLPTRAVTLHIPSRSLRVVLAVGDLDPITTDAGVYARLVNLRLAEARAGGGFTRDDLADAVSAFQRVEGLEATGRADDATRDLLRTRHGC